MITVLPLPGKDAGAVCILHCGIKVQCGHSRNPLGTTGRAQKPILEFTWAYSIAGPAGGLWGKIVRFPDAVLKVWVWGHCAGSDGPL